MMDNDVKLCERKPATPTDPTSQSGHDNAVVYDSERRTNQLEAEDETSNTTETVKDKQNGEDGCKEAGLQLLQHKMENLINEGINEGQRFALSSDLWRFAAPTPHCDVLVTVAPKHEQGSLIATWLVAQIKKFEPQLRVEVRYHRLTACYGLYFTASYVNLLKGAELCHLVKPVKPRFGGGMKDFAFDEAQCYAGVEVKTAFLTGQERAYIVKQMIEMIRAPPGGLELKLTDDKSLIIREGRAIVPALMTEGLIARMLPLHQPERLSHLRQSWVMSILDEQPISQIKEYFGAQVAMYFAWLGHLTTALWFPAIFGLFMYWFGGTSFHRVLDSKLNNSPPRDDQLFSDICFVVFALFNCVWSTLYLESWKRNQAELAFKWGTFSKDSGSFLQDPRPDFKGDSQVPNPITGRLEPHYPAWKHKLVRYGITFPVTIICVCFMFAVMFSLFRMQDYADSIFGKSRYLSWVALLPVILYALVIIVGDKLYRKLAAFLNDLENYRTEEDYENFLINKIVIFQCVSAFGSLFYIGFYLRNMKRLQETLATLLITRQVIQNVLETAVPFVTDKLKFSRLTYRMTRSMSDTTLRRHVTAVREKRQSESVSDEPPTTPDEMNSPPLLRHRRAIDGQRVQPSFMVGQVGSPHRSPRLPFPEFYPEFHPTDETEPELTQAELEALMSTYERPLDDYLEMFIQFGYVLLFSPAFPLAGLCALANNLFEIRVDAFKLCNTVQRPFGRPVRDIGSWQRAMEVMGVVGVMVNCALIGQSGLVHRLWPDLSWGGQILIVVVLEHIILAAKFALDFAIPDTPEWVRIETAKVEHWRREAFNRESKFLTMEKRDSSPAIVSRERSGTSTAAKPPVTKTPFFHKKRSITPSAPRYHIRDTEL